jgi:hypothetical protein
VGLVRDFVSTLAWFSLSCCLSLSLDVRLLLPLIHSVSCVGDFSVFVSVFVFIVLGCYGWSHGFLSGAGGRGTQNDVEFFSFKNVDHHHNRVHNNLTITTNSHADWFVC